MLLNEDGLEKGTLFSFLPSTCFSILESTEAIGFEISWVDTSVSESPFNSPSSTSSTGNTEFSHFCSGTFEFTDSLAFSASASFIFCINSPIDRGILLMVFGITSVWAGEGHRLL